MLLGASDRGQHLSSRKLPVKIAPCRGRLAHLDHWMSCRLFEVGVVTDADADVFTEGIDDGAVIRAFPLVESGGSIGGS